jgi:predicted DNA-binding transcriptional regulator YafY
MLDGRRHYQVDLARELSCSPQTVIRMVDDIQAVIGGSLDMGLDNRRRWYQIKTPNRCRLGLEFEELRYISVCRDLAQPMLPERVKSRVDQTILSLAMFMADRDLAKREKSPEPRFSFFSQGHLDYSSHYDHIEKLLKAAEARQTCLVTYKASELEAESERLFAPGQMICLGNALYALGATVTNNYSEIHNLTNMAIHRIIDVVETGRRFFFEFPEVELKAFGFPWPEPKTFRIQFNPGQSSDYIRERIWADNQKMENADDGGVILELTTRSEPELLAWVRSFGAEACLLPEK